VMRIVAPWSKFLSLSFPSEAPPQPVGAWFSDCLRISSSLTHKQQKTHTQTHTHMGYTIFYSTNIPERWREVLISLCG